MKTAVDRVRRGFGGSHDVRIARAAIGVGIITAIAKLAAAGKDVIVAHQFGAGDAVDAFFLAFAVPSLAVNVIAGSVGAAFIPAFVRVRDGRSREDAVRLLSSTLFLVVVALIAASVVLALTAPVLLPVIGSGFDHDKVKLTRSLFVLLLPMLVLSGVSTTVAAAVNAEERFGWVAIASVLNPIVTAGVLVMLASRFGIRALAWGSVLGFLAEVVALLAVLHHHGLLVWPRWHGADEDVRRVLRQYGPMVAGALITSSNPVIDQAVAARLRRGSVADLGYGSKAVTFLLAVGVMAIGTVILPHFSRLVAGRDWTGVRRTLRTQGALVLAAAIPVTLALILLSQPIVRLVFGHGAFSAADVARVAHVQQLYALQLPFFAAGILGLRLLSALESTRTLLWIGALNLLVNWAADVVFARWIGVNGIALSTSLVHVVSFALVFVMSMSKLRRAEMTSAEVAI